MQKTNLSILDDLLELEREALLAGNFALLEDICERKHGSIALVGADEKTDSLPLADLKRKILRNDELLLQAMRGVRTVQMRLSELQRVQNKLETYDQRGCRESVSCQKSILERRA